MRISFVIGDVINVTGQWEFVVEIQNPVFYRGCHPESTIKIQGFVGDSMCGSYVPKVGEKVIAFICDSSDGENFGEPQAPYKLNRYTSFTGSW